MKYKITDETIQYRGHTLHRIEALMDFGCVRKGKQGGWIEKEFNLSQEGNCWIHDEAKVYDNARVSDDATIRDFAEVFDNALVFNCATLKDKALVFGRASVYNNAYVVDNARITGNAKVYGYAAIVNEAVVSDNALVYGDATISGHSRIGDNAMVFYFPTLYNVTVRDNAMIYGTVRLESIDIAGNTIIKSANDYMVFNRWWKDGQYIVWTRSNNMWTIGCFHGTGEELLDSEDNEQAKENYNRIIKFVESVYQV